MRTKINNLEIGNLISIGISIMGVRPGINEKEFCFVCLNPHFLK